MVRTDKSNGITRTLAEFSAGLSYEDLPPEVVDWVKYLCLDFAGVTLNGSTTESAKTVVKTIEDAGRPGPSAVVGTHSRALPEYAALANGVAFHSVELDDVNNEASLHPGVVSYPTSLAMGDLAPLSGKRFITSVVTGYDVMVRLGRALKPLEHYGRGFHPTGTCGAFGAAAAAGHALGLDGNCLSHALGIAGSQTSGSMEFLAQGAWTKRFHPGWAAHSGIWAALLARNGFVGPASILEGRDGFLQAYSGDPDPDSVLPGLGEEFMITRTGIKPHSCCRYKQGPIDCLLDLKNSHHIQHQDVEEVRVGVLNAGFKLVASPEENKRNPISVVDMQFSMPFGAAAALVFGRASLSEYVPGVPERPEIRNIMERTRCVIDPALEATFPRQFRAWAEVDVKDGRTLRGEIDYPKGDPENPLTWDELKDKFLGLTSPVISARRQGEIVSRIESLESMIDARDLAALLAAE